MEYVKNYWAFNNPVIVELHVFGFTSIFAFVKTIGIFNGSVNYTTFRAVNQDGRASVIGLE
jgi:hypothetical protein